MTSPSSWPRFYDTAATHAALAAATTYAGIAAAFNAGIGAAYGVTLVCEITAGTAGYPYLGLPPAELYRARRVADGVTRALAFYPAGLWLGTDLTHIHLVVAHPEHRYFGWTYPDRMYLPVDLHPLVQLQTTTAGPEHVLHHEGAHVLTSGYDGFWLPGAENVRSDWLAYNPAGFTYTGASGNHPDNEPPAFASNYGMSSYFEDVSEVLTELFDPAQTIVPRLKADLPLQGKVRIWTNWLSSYGMATFDPLISWLDGGSTPPAEVVLPGPSCDVLGQAREYTVVLTDRCHGATLTQIDRIADVSYSRVLDDVSTCTVVLPVARLDPHTCDALGDVRAWHHELHLYRDGEEVWSGPIVLPSYATDEVTLTARDNAAWLDRLTVDETIRLEDTDLALIAEQLVRNAVSLNDDAGCLLLESTMTGSLESREIEKHSGYVGDALRELARSGLSFTCLGRRLLVFGSDPLTSLGPLTDSDFTAPLTVEEMGLDGCTRAVVVGQGVTGVYEDTSAPYRIDKLYRDTAITKQEDADLLALRLVQNGWPFPVQVHAPGSGATLTPTAPICIDDLVPGVNIRTFAGNTCRDFSTDLQLVSVQVQVGPSGERVQVTLAPPPSRQVQQALTQIAANVDLAPEDN